MDKNKWLVATNFPVHDFCLQFKQDMLDTFYSNIDYSGRTNNVKYVNKQFTDVVIPALIKVVNELFEIDQSAIDLEPWIYVQDNVKSKTVFHNHTHSASLCSTFYVDPPQQGGEFAMISDIDENMQPVVDTFSVEKDKLYFFPSWVWHAPLPQKDSNPRVCVNIDWAGYRKPIFKPANIIW